jgi:tRNA(fMet)-specific endonuclease VapC
MRAMYLLDTDHMSLLHRAGEAGDRIRRRLELTPADQIAVSIVTYEEQMRGWLADIARARTLEQQKPRYDELRHLVEVYSKTPMLPLSDEAVAVYRNLWLQRIRIGSMDMKIAAIALTNRATVVTRNVSDFGRVPNLRTEDWSI